MTENVWDYPRPPRLEPCRRRVRVIVGGATLADSMNALRVLETSHPPTIYVPPADIRLEWLEASPARPTVCEFKGVARYLDAVLDSRRIAQIGWTYPEPVPAYAALTGHVCFYPSRVDAAYLDNEPVRSQESDFYGGWITDELVGPFKGPPGTLGW